VHRVGQFVGHLTARVRPDEAALAHRILPPSAAALFDTMPVADRRHGLDVAQRLLARGLGDPDLLAAALLHDAAKGPGMRLWHRVAGVLLEAVAPRLLVRLASRDVRSWRHGLHLYLHHEPMSADAALVAGCSERAAAFIRGTAVEADAALARALHDADEAS
jgi:hypothetical protein